MYGQYKKMLYDSNGSLLPETKRKEAEMKTILEVTLTKRVICHALGVRLLSGGIGAQDAEEKLSLIIENGLKKIEAQNGSGDGNVGREVELAFFYLSLAQGTIGSVGRRAMTLFATNMATAEIAAQIGHARQIVVQDAQQIGLAIPIPRTPAT
jgi:hypothetical protein